MEIFINGRFMTQRVTGVQRFAWEVVKQLDKQNETKFTVLVPADYQDDYNWKNIQIKKIGRFTGHLWEQAELSVYTKKRPLINLCNTAPILKRNQIAVIHDVSVYAAPGGFSLPFKLWYKVLFNFIKVFSKKVLTVSEFSRSELIKYLNISPKKVSVISEGKEHFDRMESDENLLKKHSLTPYQYVLAVGSMNPNKNFRVLVEAVEHLTDENFEIVIVGGSNSKVFGKTEINNEKIKHVGYVTDEELKGLYTNAGCFIFPSLYEGFGLPPLEAMSSGCPLITSKLDPMPEVAADAAIYFNPSDPKELSEKIKYVMNNDTVKSELKIKGLERSNNFSWEKSAEQLLGFSKVFN